MKAIFFFLGTLWAGFLAASPYLWVTNVANSTVTIVDSATNEAVRIITQEQGQFLAPGPLAINSRYAFIANSNSVSVIDISSFSFVRLIEIGGVISDLKISPVNGFIYLTNSGSNQVSIIDPSDFSVTNIGGFQSPSAIAISPSGYAYIANVSPSFVFYVNVLNPDNSVSYPPGFMSGSLSQPLFITIAPNGTQAYVSNSNASSVTVLDLQNNTQSGVIGVEMFPAGIVFSADGNTAYVANAHSNSISVINTTSQMGFPINPSGSLDNPFTLALTSDGQNLYVANETGSIVVEISTSDNQLVDIITQQQGSFAFSAYLYFQPISSSGVREFQRPSNRRP